MQKNPSLTALLKFFDLSEGTTPLDTNYKKDDHQSEGEEFNSVYNDLITKMMRSNFLIWLQSQTIT